MTPLSNRQRRQVRKTIGTKPKGEASPTASLVRLPEPQRRKTGLEWLYAKKRITARQLQVGASYGADFRVIAVNGIEPLRSCLDDSPRGGGATRGGGLSFAEVDVTAAERLHNARQALGFLAELTAVADAICGKGFTPREINPDQREAAKIEQTLRIALDLMTNIYPLTDYLKRA